MRGVARVALTRQGSAVPGVEKTNVGTRVRGEDYEDDGDNWVLMDAMLDLRSSSLDRDHPARCGPCAEFIEVCGLRQVQTSGTQSPRVASAYSVNIEDPRTRRAKAVIGLLRMSITTGLM